MEKTGSVAWAGENRTLFYTIEDSAKRQYRLYRHRLGTPADADALFKGDDAFRGLASAAAEKTDFRFLRFRPPLVERNDAEEPSLPHIRLDRALQFLIGDKLQ